MYQFCVFICRISVQFTRTVYQTINLRFVSFWATFCKVCKNVLISFYYTCVIVVLYKIIRIVSYFILSQKGYH